MNRISRIAIVALMPVLALSVLAQKNNPKDKNSTPSTSAQVQSMPGMPAANDTSYVIGPSDELSVSVWEQENLSKTVPVRPDGMISLPLINDVQAAATTPMQLMKTT